jgi:hypothetical protein
VADGFREISERDDGRFYLSMPRDMGLKVQAWFADEVTDDEETVYETVTCLACSQGHLVNRVTGKVLGQADLQSGGGVFRRRICKVNRGLRRGVEPWEWSWSWDGSLVVRGSPFTCSLDRGKLSTLEREIADATLITMPYLLMQAFQNSIPNPVA